MEWNISIDNVSSSGDQRSVDEKILYSVLPCWATADPLFYLKVSWTMCGLCTCLFTPSPHTCSISETVRVTIIAGLKQWASRHSPVALATWLLRSHHWWSKIV